MKQNAYMPVDKFCGRGARPVHNGVEQIDTVICYHYCTEQCQQFLDFSGCSKTQRKRKKIRVPADFKSSVRNITALNARMEHWETIDFYFRKRDPIFNWIRYVLEDIGGEIEDEMTWWKEQIGE